MAFSDPTQLQIGATNITPVGGSAQSFARTADGKYIGTTVGDANQPYQFSVDNKINFNGRSVYTVRLTRNYNVATPVGAADDVLDVSVQVKFPHRSAVHADATSLLVAASNFAVPLMSRIILGEK